MAPSHAHTTRYPMAMWEEIKTEAARRGMSESFLIRLAVDHHLAMARED